MKSSFIRNWTLSSLSGLLAIVFGIVAIFYPDITLVTLAVYFGITVLVGGLVLIAGSFLTNNKDANLSFLLVEGIIGIAVGLIVLLKPQLSITLVALFMGLWAILLGVLFALAYRRRNMPKTQKQFLLILGIISVGIGLLLVFNPFEGTRLITILIGIYAIVYGILSIVTKRKKIGLETG